MFSATQHATIPRPSAFRKYPYTGQFWFWLFYADTTSNNHPQLPLNIGPHEIRSNRQFKTHEKVRTHMGPLIRNAFFKPKHSELWMTSAELHLA